MKLQLSPQSQLILIGGGGFCGPYRRGYHRRAADPDLRNPSSVPPRNKKAVIMTDLFADTLYMDDYLVRYFAIVLINWLARYGPRLDQKIASIKADVERRIACRSKRLAFVNSNNVNATPKQRPSKLLQQRVQAKHCVQKQKNSGRDHAPQGTSNLIICPYHPFDQPLNTSARLQPTWPSIQPVKSLKQKLDDPVRARLTESAIVNIFNRLNRKTIY